MLISHETPIDFLEHSRQYNDYDYALVHLFETHPEYYSFFKQSLAMGREVILDNSIFELKEAFNSVKFAQYIRELKPTYYIVPDVLEDSEKTIDSFNNFINRFGDLPGMSIGVVQGKTYQELVDCYKFMSTFADYIAISFDYSWYQTIGYSDSFDDHFAKLERMMTGRQTLIRMLIDDGVWNKSKPHHLLGNSLPQEMVAYRRNTCNIRSVDTSNPVVAGMQGIRYLIDYGMRCKPSVLLADLIDAELSEDQKQDIRYNVNQYKNLCQ